MMKKLECFIRPEKLEMIKDALFKIGIQGMSIYEIKGHGRQRGIKLTGRAGEYYVQWINKQKLEIFLNSSHDIDNIVDVIIKNASTGQPGDGKIFILPVDDAIRIRTGERGEKVI
ncbi:MAG: P-II family nitrogen regulator [Candidatus Helarchaeota archaeon]